MKLEKSDNCYLNESVVKSLQREPRLAIDMLSVFKSVDWETMQYFKTDAGKGKRERYVIFQRKNICSKLFCREGEKNLFQN